jgi:hypothetical protein
MDILRIPPMIAAADSTRRSRPFGCSYAAMRQVRDALTAKIMPR